MSLRTTCLVLSCIAALGPTALQAQNVLSNPGFSNALGITGWHPTGSNASFTWSSTDRLASPSSGSASIAFSVGMFTTPSASASLDQCYPAVGGTTYDIGAYVNGTASCTDGIAGDTATVSYIFWLGAGCSLMGSSINKQVPTLDGAWHLYQWTGVVSPGGAQSVQISLTAACVGTATPSSLAILFDDAFLQCTSADGSPPLVSAPVAATVTQTVCN